MCNACGNPAAPGHWTESGAQERGDRLRAVMHRMAVLQRVLKPYGYSVFADGNIPQLQLLCPGGARLMVDNLAELWAAVEKHRGQPIDPLLIDPMHESVA